MAIPVTSIAEVRADATANNVNGGWFDPGNAFSALTDGAATSATGNSPVFSSASYTFAAGDDESWVYIKSGTNWTPGFYQIASVSGGAATLRAAIGEAVQFNASQGRWMANTAAGCATTASPTGATFGVDYTQQVTAVLTQVDGAASGTTNFSSTLGGFTEAMVGNGLHITVSAGLTVGWYMIAAFVDANNVTLDRNPGTGTATIFHVGGAMSLNSTLDDEFFETVTATNGTGACIIYLRGAAGTLTLGEVVSLTASGGSQAPIRIIGYASVRGDNPTGSTRPLLNCGVNSIVLSNYWFVFSVSMTGTPANLLTTGLKSRIQDCKIVNTSTSTERSAIQVGGYDGVIFKNELISYRGRGIVNPPGYTGGLIQANYIHSCANGYLSQNNGAQETLIGNIIADCSAVAATLQSTNGIQCLGNTLFGCLNTLGIGISIPAGSLRINVVNNIISGFATGVSHADTQTMGIDDYNNYYNNDADVNDAAKWQKGPHDTAVNPAFNVGQVTGSAGKFDAGGSKLIDTSKDFTALGVVAGDTVYIISGTGLAQAMFYGVTSIATTTNPNDTLNLDVTPGTNTTADKVYQITTGHSFYPATALNGLGYPGVFSGALTTGYATPGAVQLNGAGGSGMATVGQGLIR